VGVNDVMYTGITGMRASKTNIQTAGHNISNANTKGFHRQRVLQHSNDPKDSGVGFIGRGTRVSRIERVNDSYLQKQIHHSERDLNNYSEKEATLMSLEDIFNEMDGDGLNRLMTRFFNEFRKLANDPDREATRESVREATQALVNDFHRIRQHVNEVRGQIDSKIEGYISEVNAHAENVKGLNLKIQKAEINGHDANDLRDKRDEAVRGIAQYFDIATYTNEDGGIQIDIKGVGPLVNGPLALKLKAESTQANDRGKPEGSFDISTKGNANSNVTYLLKGGKLGALVEVRDDTLSRVLGRLDDLAYNLTRSVNKIHREGFTRVGAKQIDFFKELDSKDRASEFIQVSDDVKANVNNISTAANPNAPGDNRIALAISGLQHVTLLNGGEATMDDWYNSIISEVGVERSKNAEALGQQESIQGQLEKMRDQISGVSLDEETADLLKYQQVFDASAKVISVANELMDEVMNLKK
jgi:flagellar hook-associated protein 1 FlgK